jgi:uncharacterized protein YabN with tetrapyrrole methylase and pyrophosphatase domain
LLAAYRLQARAATVGFDWPDADGPLQKVREELDEVMQAAAAPVPAPPAPNGDVGHRPPPAAPEAVIEEVGDLLFAVVNLARKLHVVPSEALDRANRKFRTRFEGVEALAGARGLDMATAGLEALDRLWDQVKAGESTRAAD